MTGRSPRTQTMAVRKRRLYMVHVVPGLEEVAATEVHARLTGTTLETIARFDERTSLLLVNIPGDPRRVLTLRTTEDVFSLAAESNNIPSDRSGLSAIRSCLLGGESLDVAVSAALSARPKRKGRLSFRVVARKAGRHVYRRVDVQRAVERAVLDRFPRWKLVEENADIEVWAQLVDARLIAAVRLSDRTMRQRTWRRASLPAALRPTVAAAMVQLSEPGAEDTFLDPMCGSGTILIERALAERYRCLLGGDVDPQAVETARANIGPRYKPIEIRRWDARELPLEAASVSAIVTNLPFGHQIGTADENRELYPALLAEWTRVLTNSGRMVLLTSERRLLRDSLATRTELIVDRQVPVLVRGYPASIYVLHKDAPISDEDG
jgi:tRNA (guanine6-N2)-methyltransferase